MPNPLMAALGGSAPMAGPFGNMQHMAQAFKQFKAQFSGDPRQKVQEMLNSGQLTQDQLNQAQQMARQFQQFLK